MTVKHFPNVKDIDGVVEPRDIAYLPDWMTILERSRHILVNFTSTRLAGLA
jgi:hypothetical protein